jgi:hypothetical protein
VFSLTAYRSLIKNSSTDVANIIINASTQPQLQDNHIQQHHQELIMVCAKCQKLTKPTSLATPEVKKKNDMYYGSPSGSKTATTKTSATLGNTGIGKVKLDPRASHVIQLTSMQSKLLSKGAKNPYAAYASNCKTCHVKCEAGRKYCQKCAYKANGKLWISLRKSTWLMYE